MEKTLVNKIANSPLITIDLEAYAPKWNFIVFDMKDYLFMEMILKEKDFRLALSQHDWDRYKGQDVLITCSVDAVIPMWAYMLITSYLIDKASNIYNMTEDQYKENRWMSAIDGVDVAPWVNKKMILKGCSDQPVPPIAYTRMSARLLPVVDSLMFGEPCSTVPVYKKVTKV